MQGFCMFFDQLGNQGDAAFRRNVRKSDEPRVRHVVQVDERSEVDVKRHENPPLGRGLLQQRAITGIRAEFPGLDNIVSTAAKPVCQTSAGAAVNKESHAFLMETAASVSPAMTARAYALQARMSSASRSG